MIQDKNPHLVMLHALKAILSFQSLPVALEHSPLGHDAASTQHLGVVFADTSFKLGMDLN